MNQPGEALLPRADRQFHIDAADSSTSGTEPHVPISHARKLNEEVTHWQTYLGTNDAVRLDLDDMPDAYLQVKEGKYFGLQNVVAFCTVVVPVSEDALCNRVFNPENMQQDFYEGRIRFLPPLAIAPGDISRQLLTGVIRNPSLKDMTVEQLNQNHDRLALIYDPRAFEEASSDGEPHPEREVMAIAGPEDPTQLKMAALMLNEERDGVEIELSLPAVGHDRSRLLNFLSVDSDGKLSIIGQCVGNDHPGIPRLPGALIDTGKEPKALLVPPQFAQKLEIVTTGNDVVSSPALGNGNRSSQSLPVPRDASPTVEGPPSEEIDYGAVYIPEEQPGRIRRFISQSR